MQNKGMIFPEPQTWGTVTVNTETGEKEDSEYQDWGWTVVKSIPIPEEDQHKYPDPTNPGTFYKNRMDMKNMKRFQKLEFMDAAEELGMFSKEAIIVKDED